MTTPKGRLPLPPDSNLFRCFLAVGFVIGKVGVAFGWRMRIKTHGHVRGVLIFDQLNNGVGKTELCIGIAALAGNAWVADKCIICTEDQCKSI